MSSNTNEPLREYLSKEQIGGVHKINGLVETASREGFILFHQSKDQMPLEKLREQLVDVPWVYFMNKRVFRYRELVNPNLPHEAYLTGGYGLFLGKPAFAITTRDRFICIHPLKYPDHVWTVMPNTPLSPLKKCYGMNITMDRLITFGLSNSVILKPRDL